MSQIVLDRSLETYAHCAEEQHAQWELDSLPRYLRRNALDYYYLSIWPGLRYLAGVASLDLPKRPQQTSHAYLHIPFCSGLCSFCSYFVLVTRDPDRDLRVQRYIDTLLQQVRIHQQQTSVKLTYIYLGGGTPGLLHPDILTRLLRGLTDLGVLESGLLGTIELHPELFSDVGRASGVLDVAAAYGITRASIGFQTHETDLLRETNRRHDAYFLAEAGSMLRCRGFTYNIDLMYGLPGQDLRSWICSLQAVCGERPDSISTYCMFVDPGTQIHSAIRRGTIELPGHSVIQAQHIAAQLMLKDEGYRELPNDFYSLPDTNSHRPIQEALPSESNSLALGAGSYGYYAGVQYCNEFSQARYQQKVDRGQEPIWRAALLTAQEELCRDIMFSLKNAPELRDRLFVARHGTTPMQAFPEVFEQLQRLDLIASEPGTCRLTRKGRLLVEEIACLFDPRQRPSAEITDERESALVNKHHFAPRYSDRQHAGPVPETRSTDGHSSL